MLVVDDLLGNRHDGGDNRQFAIGDQYPEGFLPDLQQILEVLFITGVTDLAIDPIIDHIPIGRTGHRQGDAFARQLPEVCRRRPGEFG